MFTRTTIRHIFEAVLDTDEEGLLYLLAHNVDPNGYDGLALSLACEHGHTNMVRLLLEHGADPHRNHSMALRKTSIYQRQELFDLLYPLSNPQEALQQMVHDNAPWEQRKMLEERVHMDNSRADLHHAVGSDPTKLRVRKNM